MTALRPVGLLLGIVCLFWFFQLFRRHRIRTFDFALAMLFSGALAAIALFPGVITILRDMMALENTQFSRLIAVAIVSNIALWLILFMTRFRLANQDHQMDRLIRAIAVERFQAAYPDQELAPVTVIIPAYNEAENISPVLKAIPAHIDATEVSVVVVDDGSRDGTPGIVRDSGHLVVPSPINRGGGAALRVGFDLASAGGAEIVVTMDADGQHLPEEIPNLVKPILGDEADIVIGSRIIGTREKDSTIRLVGIHLFNRIIRLLAGVKVTDCSNGFRAFRLPALAKLNLRQNQYHTPELIIEAAKKGLRIAEAPVTVKRRTSGESKKGGTLKYGFRFALSIFRTWLR